MSAVSDVSGSEWAFGWDAIASLAAAVAVLISAVAIALEQRRNRTERDDRAADQAALDAARVRRQAEHVVAWSATKVYYRDEQHGVEPYGGQNAAACRPAGTAPMDQPEPGG